MNQNNTSTPAAISISPVERLVPTVSKIQGLLYALSHMVAYPADDGTGKIHEPMDEEVEGLVWLALDLGMDLRNITSAIETEDTERHRAAYFAEQQRQAAESPEMEDSFPPSLSK